MESLYVCHFSNGHVKVGCTYDALPESRIAQHVDRVACLGVELLGSYTLAVDHVRQREGMLIELCAEAASARFQREWFTGLVFADVCCWARDVAGAAIADPCDFGQRLRAIRRERGFTQTDLGKGLGDDNWDMTKQALSHWENGRNEPNLRQLAKICARLQVSADFLVFGDVAAAKDPAPAAASGISSLPGAASGPPA